MAPRLRLKDVIAEYISGAADNASIKKYAKQFWTKHSDVMEAEVFVECKRLVFAPEGAVGLDRAMQFVGSLVAEVPEAPEELSQTCALIVEELLQKLQPFLTLLSPVFRARAVGLVKVVLHAVNVALSEDTLGEIIASMVERLDDKVADIRKLAAAALAKCAACDEAGRVPSDDPVVLAFERLLVEENALGVRAALVQHLPLTDTTIDSLINATQDSAHEVRAAVYARFTSPGVPLVYLTVAQRVVLLQRGLRDQQMAVRGAARAMAAHWLQHDCQGNIVQLVGKLDVAQNPDTAEALFVALTSQGDLDPSTVLQGCALRKHAADAAAPLVEPAMAFIWHATCVLQYTSAVARGAAAAKTTGAAAQTEAAEAVNKYDVLDTFLPETGEQMTRLVVRHAAAGPAHRFATRLLLEIATQCMDWVDGPSRAAAQDLLQALVTLDPCEHLPGTAAAFSTLHPAGLLAGSGGSGAWEAAVISFAARFMPAPEDLVRHVLGEVEGLAERWVLTAGAADAVSVARQQQCLAYIRALAQQLAGAKVAPAAPPPAWVLAMLQDGVKSENEGVQAEALRCMGLIALLPGGNRDALCTAASAAREQLGTQLGDRLEVQRASAQVLLDLMLVYGQREVEVACGRAAGGADGPAAPGISDLANQLGCTDLGDSASCQGAASQVGVNNVAPTVHLTQPLHTSVLRSLQGLLTQLCTSQQLAVQAAGKKRGPSKAAQAVVQPAGTPARAALLVTLAEGLSRLALYQATHEAFGAYKQQEGMALTDEQVQRIIIQLLVVLVCSEAGGDIAHARQCLAVFFEVFCARGARTKRHIAAATLAAARSTLGVSLGPRRSAAPSVIKYVTHMLHAGAKHKGAAVKAGPGEGGEGDEGESGHAGLQEQGHDEEDVGGEQLCRDILVMELNDMPRKLSMKLKSYYGELAAALSVLPFREGVCEDAQACAVLTLRATLPPRAPTDKTITKHLEAARARFERLAAAAVDLDEAAVAAVWQQELERARPRLDQLPAIESEGLVGSDEEGTQGQSQATTVGGRKPAVRARRTVRRKGDSDVESDDGQDAPDQAVDNAPRRANSRQAAAKARSRMSQQAAEEAA